MNVVISNNSHVYQLLLTPPFRRAYSTLSVAESMESIMAMVESGHRIVIIDTELYDASGFDTVREIKKRWPETRVLLITHAGLDASEMRMAVDSGADEISILPIDKQEFLNQFLRLVGAPHRRLPRIDLTDTQEYVILKTMMGTEIRTRILNLHTAGCKLYFDAEMPSDDEVILIINGIEINSLIVWRRESSEGVLAGVSFTAPSPQARDIISELISWRMVQHDSTVSIHMRRSITSSLPFDSLVAKLQEHTGTVRFDLRRVTEITPPGAISWTYAISQLATDRILYSDVHAPVLFQMMMMPDRFPGHIESLRMTYHCPGCGVTYEEGLEHDTCMVCGGPLKHELPPDALQFAKSRIAPNP